MGVAFPQGWGERIFIVVFFDEVVYGSVCDGGDGFDEVPNPIGIDGIPEFELGFHLIAFGDGYLPHVVAEADEFGALPIVPRAGGPHPRGQAVLRLCPGDGAAL